MEKEEMPRRKYVLRGAMDTGCGFWAPIRCSGMDSGPGNTSIGIDPATPDAATDAAATVPANSEAER